MTIEKTKWKLFKEGVANPSPSTMSLTKMLTSIGMGLGGILATVGLFMSQVWGFGAIMFFFSGLQIMNFLSYRKQFVNIEKIQKQLKEERLVQTMLEAK